MATQMQQVCHKLSCHQDTVYLSCQGPRDCHTQKALHLCSNEHCRASLSEEAARCHPEKAHAGLILDPEGELSHRGPTIAQCSCTLGILSTDACFNASMPVSSETKQLTTGPVLRVSFVMLL